MQGNISKDIQIDHPGLKDLVSNDLANPGKSGKEWIAGIVFYTLIFVLSILCSVTPLVRTVDPAISLHIPLGLLLSRAGSWLPLRLGGPFQNSSNSLEFFGLISLAFLMYGLCMLFVARQPEKNSQIPIRLCIWLGALLVGIIYLVTPAMLSHDMMVYAGYSRLLAVHHANPYFVPLSSFPHDPITTVDQWSQSVSAYGPIWMLVCGFWGYLLKPDPTTFTLAFRLFALITHLFNIWLVGRTLQTTGRSPRIVTLGMLFYAWNPLVLLESSLDGHNDVFMIMFVLVGILLAVHAERNGQPLRMRGYLLPTTAFTMAALVKFTALPVLAAYLLFLTCKELRSDDNADDVRKLILTPRNWKRASLLLCRSVLIAILVATIFYGPFWFGHNLRAISSSFNNTPSSTWAENSFMRSLISWLKLHPAQTQNRLLAFLRLRRFWDDLTYLSIAICLLLGAYWLCLKPVLSTFKSLALATMCTVLLITPWFYPWYITWLIGLAAVSLPKREERATWALFALVLVFSYSALSVYTSSILGSHGYLWPLFNTLPPVCAFLFSWIAHPALYKTVQMKSTAAA